jgi:hypothetical protein
MGLLNFSINDNLRNTTPVSVKVSTFEFAA